MGTENQNNGRKIRVEDFEDRFKVTRYTDQEVRNGTSLLNEVVVGVRNSFQEKRDRALGRWRDPVDPDMVCYPVDGSKTVDLRVLDERTGESFFYARYNVLDQKFRPSFETANRYFASHPTMRPWEEAKEGEYWLVTWSHLPTPEPCIVVSIYGDLFFKSITECRELSSRYIEHAQKLVVEED